jgi:type IV secretion system protein VirD4
LTIGPNGSGKTRKLLLPNLYRLRDWSCVVIDPKGELAAHTALARFREPSGDDPGHRVVIVDPFGVMKGPEYAKLVKKNPALFAGRGVNPLTALDPASDRFIDAAKAIAEALIKTDDARDPYWPMAAQALIKGLLLGLRLHTDAATLGGVREMLGQPPKRFAETCRQLIETYGGQCPALAPSLARFVEYTADNKELGAILGTALTQTDWLDSPEMKRNLRGEPFDFGTLKTQPTTVYLILPPEFLGSHGIWLRLMVSTILRPLLRSVEVGDKTVPVLFMLDEFAQLGYMKIIEDSYALMRGYGVKLWTVWQDLTQAQQLYDKRWESFLANAGIRQTFSPQDLTTRDYLARMSDKRQEVHNLESGSLSLGLKAMPSLNLSSGETRLDTAVFNPHELSALDLDEAIFWDRMMDYYLSITPQPHMLTMPLPDATQSVAQLYAQARAAIEQD